jgi:hypothetical protein
MRELYRYNVTIRYSVIEGVEKTEFTKKEKTICAAGESHDDAADLAMTFLRGMEPDSKYHELLTIDRTGTVLIWWHGGT